MTDPPSPAHLPVPLPQAAERPVRWRFRPRWAAVALMILWAMTAAGISFMRQQDARTLAAAQAHGMAGEAAVRLDAVVALVRAAAGENRGPAAFSAAAATVAALAPGDWLGIVRTDAYGSVTESRGTVRPTPAVLRGAVIAAHPLVSVETTQNGAADQPIVVVTVPVTGPAMVESVIAVALHPRFWRPEREDGAAEAALLAPGCTLLTTTGTATGVTDAGRCRQRLAVPEDESAPAGLGRLGTGGGGTGGAETEWEAVVLAPVTPRTAAFGSGGGPWAGPPWMVAVPPRTERSAAVVALWCLGPAGIVLLGMPWLPGAAAGLARRWRRRATESR